MKVVELMFVLPELENVVFIDREKPNTSWHIGQIKNYFEINTGFLGDKEVSTIAYNKKENRFEIIYQEE